MKQIHAIDKAARLLDVSLDRLGAELGVTKAAVSQWKSQGRSVPINHCVSIERLTNGGVTRRELRPDDWMKIWPELVD